MGRKGEPPESDARPVQFSKDAVIKRGGSAVRVTPCDHSNHLMRKTWISKVVIHIIRNHLTAYSGVGGQVVRPTQRILS